MPPAQGETSQLPSHGKTPRAMGSNFCFCLGKMRPGEPVFSLCQSYGTVLVRNRPQAKRKAAEGYGLTYIVSHWYKIPGEPLAEIHPVIPSWMQYREKLTSSARELAR